MPASSLNKKNKNGNIRRSLDKKAFLITMLLTLGIGITMLIAGFALYIIGVSNEYYINTWNLANAEAAVLDQKDYRDLCDEIIEIYDSLPEEVRKGEQDEAYLAHFAHLRDDRFRGLQEAMHSLQRRNGPMNSFIVAIDEKTNRMIYLVDADQDEETICLPGSWEQYEQHEVELLVHGFQPSGLERRQGIADPIQATFTFHKPYGRRCTAGATLYTTDKYTVMVCVDEKLQPVVETGRMFLAEYVTLLLIVTLIASYIGMSLMKRAMVNPIDRMAKAARKYEKSSDKLSGKRYFDKLDINTGDEIERLASTLTKMEESLGVYMTDLTEAAAEKERINTELSLAAAIQRSMLTTEFPERNEFRMYASMEPAKEVGGDFYDVIVIDDDHLAIEIADVSDKGIPAALFMMATKIMIADGLKDCSSPAKLLSEINEKICAGNEEEMFVTVWLGILEISTGKITASNAGHEYPIIIHADGSAELLRDKHGFVIGGLPGMTYTDYEIRLDSGDKLFLYTDGASEAASLQNELLGTKRIMTAIEKAGPGISPEETTLAVRQIIREFTVGAEQFDDLTMLCLEYRK